MYDNIRAKSHRKSTFALSLKKERKLCGTNPGSMLLCRNCSSTLARARRHCKRPSGHTSHRHTMKQPLGAPITARATPHRTPMADEQTSSSPKQEASAAAQAAAKEPSQMLQQGQLLTAAQFIAIGLVVLCPFQLKDLTTFAGILLLIGGLATFALGGQLLGSNFDPLPKPKDSSELVTTGIYGYVRHPMYSGTITSAFGLGAVLHDESRLLLAILLLLIIEHKVKVEEKLLVERYGAAYELYQASVKKYLPYIY